MKQNKNNRFAALLLALCMAVCCALPALAAPAASANIDLSRTGSMDVTLYDHQNDVPLRGGALTVYKVADVARTNGDLHFVYTADFAGCGIALGDLTDSTLASRLEAKLPARAAGTTHKISEQGIVSFDALPLGLYLVVQTENSKGYEAINSFLVSLPMADESGWLYTVDATPQGGRAHAGGDPARTGNSQHAFGTGQTVQAGEALGTGQAHPARHPGHAGQSQRPQPPGVARYAG